MSVGYVTFDGTNDHVETVDKAALDVSGDLDIIVALRIDDWADTTFQTIISKGNAGTDGGSWILRQLQSTNVVELVWRTTVSTTLSPNSGTFALLGDGVDGWMRVTLDLDNGGNYQLKYYESTDALTTDPTSVSWTDVSTANGGGTTDINPSAGDVTLGWRSDQPAGEEMAGRIYGAWVYDGIGGTEVANPDFRDASQGDWSNPPQNDDHSNSWVFNDNAVWTPPQKAPLVVRRTVARSSSIHRRHQVFN